MRMKTKQLWAGSLWILLAFSICLVPQTSGQEPSPGPDSLVAPLPKLLQSEEGFSIESSAQWEQIRRPEILELFRDQVYGRVPDAELQIHYRVVFEDRESLKGTAIQKEVEIKVCGSGDTLLIPMLIFLPKQPSPAPLFLGLNFNGNQTVFPDPRISVTTSWVRDSRDAGVTDNRASEASRGTASSRWPVELILSRGYGVATIYYGDIDPDYDDGFLNGIHGLVDPGASRRTPSSWGSIAAWAWGLSRAMDYFERDADIDPNRVAVMGHSRLGKTSLWAGALDRRFALVISNDSGCGGAALSRRPFGERVTNINTVFPHWFASAFHAYNDNEGSLPVDQHMLLALVAPRPLYVASAQGDAWADPRGEYLSLFYASRVYSLYDPKNALSDRMPAVDQPVSSGNLGYHMRSGGHDVTRYDWEQFLDFADLHMQGPAAKEPASPVTEEWVEEHLFGTHPRLILTPRLEQQIWQQMDSGDSLTILGMELLRRQADSMLNSEPLERKLTGRRLLGVSREAIGRLTTLSLAYRFHQDPRYLQKLEEELRAVCGFEDWNPSHFLDVAEMAAGVALALDWAGEWLSPEVMELAHRALVDKALGPATDPTGDNWWIATNNNWNLVCHGGLSLAALTVFEQEPRLASAVLRQAVEHIPLALLPYGPEGVYPEGVSYWFYATTYLTSVLSACETALGTDFGFSRVPGVRESAVFSQVMAGPSGEYYNFFDSGLEGFGSLTHLGLLSWFARRSGIGVDRKASESLFRSELEHLDQVGSARFFPVFLLHMVQADPGVRDGSGGPGNWSGQGEEPVVILGDPVRLPDGYFLAAKGGRAADNHGNMDAGSFVFELDGVRWSVDPGNQDYNALEQIMGMDLWNSAQDSPRWSLLTKSSEGHSTLVVNGEKHVADARATLVFRDIRGPVPQYTFDLGAIYGSRVEQARRSFSRPSGTMLHVSDEVAFSPETRNLTWQLITRADIEIEGDGATLRQDGATLHMRVSSQAPFHIRVVSLDPPPLPYDKRIEGLKRLEVTWDRGDFPGDGALLQVDLDSKPIPL